MASLGICCNVYNEALALPGWLEMATGGLFDDVQVMHAGPNGAESTDGTIELLQKWRIPIHRMPINAGFGVVRSAAVRSCKTDFVMILDADERFYRIAPVLQCTGESTPADEERQILQEYDSRTQESVPSNFENLHLLGSKLKVDWVLDAANNSTYDQGAWLRDILNHGDLDGVQTIRRHWHDFSWTKPTQNWHQRPDHQLRIIRNHPSIHWDSNVRMHEALIGAENVHRADDVHGPFFDHHHIFWKRKAPHDRRFKLSVYDSLHSGQEMPSAPLR